MSAKNRDNKNRWRNITVGFRVSPEENERINKAVALSGLQKQEYCYRRCLNQDVVVQGNPRVYKALKQELAAVLAAHVGPDSVPVHAGQPCAACPGRSPDDGDAEDPDGGE